MRTIELDHKTYSGTYQVYEEGIDENIPEYIDTDRKKKFETHFKLIKGAFVKDISGLVAPVIDLRPQRITSQVKSMGGALRLRQDILIITPYGLDFFLTYEYNGSLTNRKINNIFYHKLDFNRSRKSFLSTSKAERAHLNTKDRIFIRAVVLGEGLVDAYKRIYETEIVDPISIKYAAANKFNQVFFHKECQDAVSGTLKDLAAKRGYTPEFFLDKLDEAISKGINKPFHLDILRMLGRASGNTEIVQMMEPELLPNPQDANAGRLPAGVEETTYEQIEPAESTEEKLLT
jgi:hypothetical protein